MDFYTKTIHYVADSRGGWYYGTPLAQDAFQQRRPMQILVHPIWWREEATAPLTTLHDFEARRQATIQSEMGANSTIYRPRPTQKMATNGLAQNNHGLPPKSVKPLPTIPVLRNGVGKAA
jgi:hypothetical protein